MNNLCDYKRVKFKTLSGSLVFIGRDDEYLNLKVAVLSDLDDQITIPVVDGDCRIPNDFTIWARWDRALKIVGEGMTRDCIGRIFKVYNNDYHDLILQIFE